MILLFYEVVASSHIFVLAVYNVHTDPIDLIVEFMACELLHLFLTLPTLSNATSTYEYSHKSLNTLPTTTSLPQTHIFIPVQFSQDPRVTTPAAHNRRQFKSTTIHNVNPPPTINAARPWPITTFSANERSPHSDVTTHSHKHGGSESTVGPAVSC